MNLELYSVGEVPVFGEFPALVKFKRISGVEISEALLTP